MKVGFLEQALNDLLEGFAFYEKQSVGLGADFAAAIIPVADALAYNAGIHPMKFGEYHMALSTQFPFAIYYTVEDDVVVIHAVSDCRKDPAWLKRRLISLVHDT